MPYRLRLSFADAHRKGDIDFTYDGSSTWTPPKKSAARAAVTAFMTKCRA